MTTTFKIIIINMCYFQITYISKKLLLEVKISWNWDSFVETSMVKTSLKLLDSHFRGHALSSYKKEYSIFNFRPRRNLGNVDFIRIQFLSGILSSQALRHPQVCVRETQETNSLLRFLVYMYQAESHPIPHINYHNTTQNSQT